MSDALKARIAGLFDEPGCATNQKKGAKERKDGCKKPLTPGAAAGGCAFDGAKIALQPIADAVHLVHGPAACEGNGWDGRHTPSSRVRAAPRVSCPASLGCKAAEVQPVSW